MRLELSVPSLDVRLCSKQKVFGAGLAHGGRCHLSHLRTIALEKGYAARRIPINQQARWTAEIAVNAPLKTVWEVVDDVTLIPRYHPEVVTVDVIAGQAKRAVGTKYQCNILEGRHAGSCVEEVLAYELESMVATGMVSDTWGIDKMLADFRVVSTLSRRTETSTILRFEALLLHPLQHAGLARRTPDCP